MDSHPLSNGRVALQLDLWESIKLSPCQATANDHLWSLGLDQKLFDCSHLVKLQAGVEVAEVLDGVAVGIEQGGVEVA